MSQQPIETEVVLTTDNSQYDRSMQSSASITDSLAASVDTLAGKLKSITQAAGHKALGVAAADTASIVAATVAYASFEKQMTSLNAQAAVLNKSYTEGNKLAASYTNSVNALRGSFGTTTNDAAALVQTISKMSDGTASVDKLANSFTKMGNATQENVVGLTTSVLQLSRTMGTPQRDIGRYQNSLTTLAAGANTSATAIADFAQQIAPVGRLVGQSQADIQGVSTAFIKAGQDGYRAATVYNKVLTDINYATQSGSPDLAKYANFVGMTTDAFKGLSGTDQIVSFFNQVNRLGPDAITSLNRMGLDGANTVKAITAVTSQTGGLGASIAKSRAAMSDDSVDRGNAAAMKGLTDNLAKLRSQLAMTAESMGSRFAPAAGKMVDSLTAMARAAHAIADSPLGSLGAMAMAATAPLMAMAGALLLAAPLLAKLGTFALLARGAGTMGLREGFKGAPIVTPGVSKMNQGVAGTQIAANGSWLQRYQYNALNRLGAGAAGIREAGQTAGFFGFRNPSGQPLSTRVGAGAVNAGASGMRNLLTPLYSPLSFKGYNDLTQRSRFVNDSRNPFVQARDAYRERMTGRSYAPTAAQQTIDKGTSMFDKDVKVTEEGRVTSSNAAKEATVRNAAAREAGTMSAAFANAGRAAGGLAAALASAAGNASYLGAKGTGGLFGKMIPGSSAAGIGLLMGGTALGINSNALTFGGTGLMLGSKKLGAAGAVIGAGFDLYQQNKSYNQTLDAYNEANKDGTLAERYTANMNAIAAGKATAANWKPGSGGLSGAPSFTPKQIYGMAQDDFLSVFTGKDVAGQKVDKAVAAEDKNVSTAQALFNLGLNQKTLTGSVHFTSDGGGVDKGSWDQLNGVLTQVQPSMDKLHLTINDLNAAWAHGAESPEWLTMLDKLADPAKFTGLNDRIAALGKVGFGFINNSAVTDAIKTPADMNAQYRAVRTEYDNLSGKGVSTSEILRQMGNIQATAGSADEPTYQLAAGVSQQALREQSYLMPFMTRTQQFSAQAKNFASARRVMDGDPNQQQNMAAAEDSIMQSANAQGDYFKQLLVQKREFDISQARARDEQQIAVDRMDTQYDLSRKRAYQDFNISKTQQEESFNLSRQFAEQDFNINRERGVASYYRTLRRNEREYNISRRQQEQDYQHSIKLMVESNAKSMYDVYSRVKVQSTDSANFLLFNGQDQLKRLRDQESNLSTLRKSGVSDDVIQKMGLTDTDNAQQLARFVSEITNNPALVQEFNKQVAETLKAAAALTKDSSSSSWQEFQHQYQVQRNRAENQFKRQVAQSHQDFKRQMSEMDADFKRSMDHQAEQFDIAETHQEEAFHRSMKRGAHDYNVTVKNMAADFNRAMTNAKDDLERSSHEITGTLEQVLQRATNKLGGHAGKQAAIVLATLRGLDTDATRVGIQLMTDMSNVFGFKLDRKVQQMAHGQVGVTGSGQGQASAPSAAAGGVLNAPRSIGSDNMLFHSPKHGSLALAGGEAIMVPEWVDKVGGPKAVNAMNQAARKGYASGGNIPAVGDWNQHVTGYPWARWAGDINVPGSGDYGNPVRAYKDGTVSEVAHWNYSYGNHVRINHPQSDEQTLYAHMSEIMVKLMQDVHRGQQIGKVGQSGNASGPHLHFEIKGGTSPISTGGTATTTPLSSILQSIYPGLEDTASKFTIGGGWPRGTWSKQMNKWARQAFRKYAGSKFQHAPDLAPPSSAGGDNQDIVKSAMHNFGWNEWPSLYQLVMHESGFNNTAQNKSSTAYGMFQFLDSTWAGVGGHKTSDPALQSLYGMRYIKNRYGDPDHAWKAWESRSPHWYGDGGILSGAQHIGVGERGPEMVLPLNGGGANFLVDLFRKMHVGTDAKATNVHQHATPVGHTYTTYQIDRSTTFSGPITVQASDPNEMITKLRARQRVQAMAQASLGGVRG